MASNFDVSFEEQLNDIDDIIGHDIHHKDPNDASRDQEIPDLPRSFDPPAPEPDANLLVINLKAVYDKVQKKTLTGSEQRVANGVIDMEVTGTGQMSTIRVFVRRCQNAAVKTCDKIGTIELPVQFKSNNEAYKTKFAVDLDSVYQTQDGSFVYWLDRVEVEDRNIWELVIFVEFIDNTEKTFQSCAFRIRTKPRTNQKKSAATETQPAHHDHEHINHVPSSPPPILYDEHEPLIGPGNKRKRSSFSTGTSSYGAAASPFSGLSWSPGSDNRDRYEGESTPSRHSNDVVLTDYLEAQRAQIKHLKVQKMISSPNADIAYHLKLEGPYYRKHDLEEGDIVGFFENKTDGGTEIAKLTLDNVTRARMAGVISRSAYLHANEPETDIELTDTVCVIGIVKVKIAGPVQNGERVYASFDHPGVGIPETQIPLRPFSGVSPILLGQALEARHAIGLDNIHRVKCFVSIVLGIQSQQVANAIEDIRMNTQKKLAETVRREKKKFYRALICKGSIILFILTLFTILMCEIFIPGSLLRYWWCERGSIAHHNMWFKYTTSDHQTPVVHGIEFTWEDLKKRLDLNFRDYNETGTHYYLNLERCAYGGIVSVRSYIDHKPQVRGPEIFAVNSTCNGVLYEMDGRWHKYTTARDFRCEPPYTTT